MGEDAPTAGSGGGGEPGESSQLAWGDAPGDPRENERIGPYVIRGRLGEGGFAVVYLADQLEPVRRRVAIKMIKPGMDSRQIVARFEAERQALALMSHPNVANVLDAGTTEAGRMYFVMEHVRGEAITAYCDRNRLSVPERLVLFQQACHAVQHAHHKGIIHRDIKPSNVLVSVDDEPMVKVIDFGVAKALHRPLTDKTIFTEQGQLIGTPEYMSPEQAEMGATDVDARTDVYSLGVLLYELLTGSRPFDPTTLRQAAFGEIQRMIREGEVPRPSTRLSSIDEESAHVASRRRSALRTLEREVRGDLDWITMRALEKDRTRRYSTPDALAEDVQRHLDDEPVEAGPPSVAYRFSKLIRRHRTGMAAASLVLLALFAGIAATSVQAVRATRAETAANVARAAEEKLRIESDRQAEEARALAYTLCLAVASAALDNHDLATARRRLAQAPVDRRGWEWGYLYGRLDDAVEVIEAHEGAVTAIDVSPDGKLLASVSMDCTVRVRDLASGKELHVIREHAQPAMDVEFSPDGRLLATASLDQTLRIWTVDEGKQVRLLMRDEQPVLDVAWQAGNVLSGGFDGHLRAHDADSGARQPDLGDLGASIEEITVSPDGRWIAAGGMSGTLSLWETAGGSGPVVLEGHTSAIGRIAFAGDSRLIATASTDGRVGLWEPPRATPLAFLEGHKTPVHSVAFTPDGRRIAAGSSDGEIRIWDVVRRSELGVLRGHVGSVYGLEFLQNDILLSSSMDNSIRRWDLDVLNRTDVLRGHDGIVLETVFLPDGTLLTGSVDGSVLSWDPERGTRLSRTALADGTSSPMALTPDGRRLAVGGPDGTVVVRRWPEATELIRFKERTPIVALAFADGGALLIVALGDQRVQVRSSETGVVLHVVSGHVGEIRRIAVTADGSVFATASLDGTVRIYATDGTQSLLVEPADRPMSVAFSPGGDRLAVGDTRGGLTVWDVATGARLAGWATHSAPVNAVAYSPDGTRIVTASDDGTLRVHAPGHDEPLLVLHGHDYSVQSVAFSADGLTIASGSLDRTARVWRSTRRPQSSSDRSD